MKKLSIIILILFAIFNIKVLAQNISCSEVYKIVTENYDSKDYAGVTLSSLLVSVKYYRLDDMGFVIAYIKENEFDYTGNPYIFCGISEQRWRTFKTEGVLKSWGKSFHYYIMDFTCNCY